MNVTVKQLRGFVAIAHTGSFAEACEQLHLSQPALSVSIRKLEEATGGLLFSRSTRSVALTPEGREFLPVAKRLLGDWSEGLEDLRQLFTLQRGKISVAAMPSYASNCLPSVLAEYGQHFPNIAVTVLDVVMEEVIESVQSGRAELGITFRPDMLDGVDFQPLFSDRFIAVLPPHHRLIEKPQLRLKDLLSGTLVALNRGSSTRQWTDELIVKARLQPPQIFEAYQLTTVGAMVAAGLGVGLVPALCAGQMRSLGAVCRPISGTGIEREVGIFTRRRHALSSAAQALLKLLVPLY
ncbi:MAG: LysR family carnitine catabolism transcriptional activator [Parasphingorhabdus sp.]|jgi:LysR family carnitine catabolism transcriptional activator|tara:strand:- start:2550 stop:3434 length:885 start_codon:yes stop_codon:yes gene_type:complete